MKKLPLALLIAAVVNVPAAEAIFISLSLQPGGSLHASVPYTFRIARASCEKIKILCSARSGILLLGENNYQPAIPKRFTKPKETST